MIILSLFNLIITQRYILNVIYIYIYIYITYIYIYIYVNHVFNVYIIHKILIFFEKMIIVKIVLNNKHIFYKEN